MCLISSGSYLLTFFLEGPGGSYVTADIALCVIAACTLHHHDTIETCGGEDIVLVPYSIGALLTANVNTLNVEVTNRKPQMKPKTAVGKTGHWQKTRFKMALPRDVTEYVLSREDRNKTNF
jgi:hypothetical protein